MKRGSQKTVEPVSFRLYPDGSFLYCQVNIWPTKKAMDQHLPLTRHTQASCGGRESYIVPKGKGRLRKTGLFAEANFYKRRIGVEVMSHELTHAAFAFADRRKLPLGETVNKQFAKNGRFNYLDNEGAEERFCYALGRMVRQFTVKCYAVGLYHA